MEGLKLDDFTKYKFLSGIQLSPNGESTGFILHRIDREENKYLSNIHIHKSKTNEIMQLNSLDEEDSFIWKDDKTIVFPATRHDQDRERKEKKDFTSYYEINIHGGEASKSFEVPLEISSLKFLDDD